MALDFWFNRREHGKQSNKAKSTKRSLNRLGTGYGGGNAIRWAEALEDRAMMSGTTCDTIQPDVSTMVTALIGSQTAGGVSASAKGSSSDASTGVATQFAVYARQDVNSGDVTGFVVVAKDVNGRIVRDYTGTVHFTSTDAAAILPADYTFTASDRGRKEFSATLSTIGAQSITATSLTDTAIVGTANITVNTAPVASKFGVYVLKPAATGSETTVVIVAVDATGHYVKNYNGTVTLTSSDSVATFPATVSLVDGKATVKVTFNTVGVQSITATDATNVDAPLTGTGSAEVKAPVAVAKFTILIERDVQVGLPTYVTVVALDANGKQVRTYSGTATVTSTDTGATLPASITFENGKARVQVTFSQVGTFNLVVDAAATEAAAEVTATKSVTVNEQSTAVKFALLTFPSGVLGRETTVILVAVDSSGRPVKSYTGTATLTSSDTAAVIPTSVTFKEGRATLKVTFNTIGSQTLTATDATGATVLTGTATVNVVQRPTRGPGSGDNGPSGGSTTTTGKPGSSARR